jgi:hypothetical protein
MTAGRKDPREEPPRRPLSADNEAALEKIRKFQPSRQHYGRYTPNSKQQRRGRRSK